jgi:linear primary-alkylsulfatase
VSTARKPATAHTARRNREVGASLSLTDRADFDEARRGLIAELDPPLVERDDGRAAWDLRSYDFLDGEAPDTAHPSLWRLGKLNRIAGLFELAPGFYQLRGFDLSNMHVVEGDEGIVVIDPLVSAETAAAALALYREHRGERPVTGLVYTHSHVDHFGGAKGVVSEEEIEARGIPVLAPTGFLHHAVSENVFAGTAMGRRAGYMYGALLERGPDGQLGSGLGQTTSLGAITLIPPNLDVGETGQVETVDGVRMTFQLTPGTEAPAEMNIYFPEAKALCIADNVARSMHNILTPRGALVRDPRVWAHYLDEAIELFGAETEVLFSGHNWPCWSSERIVDYLGKQRDLYTYLHDQTLRLLNKGHTGPEIAELVELPPSLAREWHCREYYGSVSHNTKAIYQRYMGWFDGNPAHLWEHPPQEQAQRYVEFMGGAEAVLKKARASFEIGDYRWVAEVVNHVVFAEPENEVARELQADALEQLGYGAENATWRNFFLSGATELRQGNFGTAAQTTSASMLAQLTPEQIFDTFAISVNGPRAWDLDLAIDVTFLDVETNYRVTLRNGVLVYRKIDANEATANATIKLANKLRLLAFAAGDTDSPGLEVVGDADAPVSLLAVLDRPDPNFNIVTP